MQDNRLNDKLEDQGWQAMKNLLDQEMPVRKKRRRPFLLWIFFLGVLIGGSLIGATKWGFIQHPFTNVQIPMNEPSPTSGLNHSAESNSEHCVEEKASSPLLHPISSVKNDPSGQNKYTAPIQSSRFARLQAFSELPSLRFYVNSPLTKPLWRKPLFFPIMDSVTVVAPLTFGPLVSPTQPLRALVLNPKQWRNVLASGLYFNDSGILTGGSISYSRGRLMGQNQRSMISIGAGLKFHQVEVDFANLNQDAGVSLDAAAGSGLDNQFGQQGTNVNQERVAANYDEDIGAYSEVYQLIYFSVPITYRYHWKSTLSFLVGTHFDFLLSDGTTLLPMTTNEAFNTSVNFSQDSFSPQFNQANLSLQLGAYYRFTPKWSVGIQRQQGLLNLLKNGEEQVFLSRNQLGVRFEF